MKDEGLLLFVFFRIIGASMLQSELIFNVKNLKAGGIQSDDENLSDRQIAFIIDYYRAKLMRQEAMKHNSMDGEDIQDLGRVSIIKADPHECDCPADACILRTELPLPSTLNPTGFTFVGHYGGTAFQETTWQRGPWDSYAKYTGDKPKWFTKGRYIYLLNPPDPMMSVMNIQGLFESPQEAEKFRTCDCDNGVACNTGFDFEYPVAAHLVDTIMKMMMESEVRWSTLIPTDTANDSLDSN
jgi:hypothetical protein